MQNGSKVIWFDFDNAPHVPVLLPIAREMRNRGYETGFTARDKAETEELLVLNNEQFRTVGKSFPKNKLFKLFFTIKRAINLILYLNNGLNAKPIISVSHSSRSALLASWLKRIPSVALYDYEYVNSSFQNILATKVLMPDVFDFDRLKKAGVRIDNLGFYPGIKEQIYINSDIKKKDLLSVLGIDKSKIIILLRPPGDTGHYHNPKSELILNKIIERISQERNKVFLIILPRTKEQKKYYNKILRQKLIPFVIPKTPLNGIDLILNSDFVLSGGGTITREAAVLGVPSFSFFQGPKGAVDTYLEKIKRLTFINSTSDVEKIYFKKKVNGTNILDGKQEEIISIICNQLESLIS